MIGFQHTDLPQGLNAVALPKGGSGPQLLLSRSLGPAEQRAAAVSAIRAAKRAGWIRQREQVALLLPIAAASVRHALHGLLAHLTTVKGISTAAAATTVAGVATAVAITVTPAINLHIIPVRPSAPHAARLVRRHAGSAAPVPRQSAKVAGMHTTTKNGTHPTMLGSGSAGPTTSSAPAPSASASVSVSPPVPDPSQVCVPTPIINVCL